jgi:hypothetical protein
MNGPPPARAIFSAFAFQRPVDEIDHCRPVVTNAYVSSMRGVRSRVPAITLAGTDVSRNRRRAVQRLWHTSRRRLLDDSVIAMRGESESSGVGREKMPLYKVLRDRPIQLVSRPSPSCNGIFVVWQPQHLSTLWKYHRAAQRTRNCRGSCYYGQYAWSGQVKKCTPTP